MRELMQGEEDNPKVGMENNCRPVMPLHKRAVRTNIEFQNPVSPHACLKDILQLIN